MKFIIISLLVLISNAYLSAQEIVGSIRSSDGEPIIEAYIFNPSGTIHSHSDLLGNFIINGLSVGDTLKVSYVGYENVSRVLSDQDFNKPIELILEEGNVILDQVKVSGDMRSAYEVSTIDLLKNPVKSSQDILQKVPGLIIAQHAGGGKAEQIFLRGFDIDHGTDIAISVDGMPVNMVSHAHGQGYSDLHFLIPETVADIEFGKGPYYADIGNFGTAGYVNFSTKDKIKESKLGIEYGDFDSRRVYGILDLMKNVDHSNAYIATEYIYTDGPFESSQNFNRINIMGKYIKTFADQSRLSVQASRFTSKWDASGQIPQRLVDNGEITRFGAVDDTEGGITSRSNLAINHTKVLGDNMLLKSNAYFVNYDFQLFSNFTFFLDNPEDGDQIMQYEDRSIYGLESSIFHTKEYDDFSLASKLGLGLRQDNVIDNELSSTLNRRELRERFAFGDVYETDLFAYASAELDFGKWLLVPGLRADVFSFEYVDKLQTEYNTQSKDAVIISPKLNLIYNPNSSLQLYFKMGKGYHANDTRVSIFDDLTTLPAAYGADLGTVWKPSSKVWLSAALWHLYLEQEFVYVGDAAIVEPSGKTRRQGIELGTRIQLTDRLYFDSDGTYTIARSVNDPEGENYIPLAPDLTIAGGLSYGCDKVDASVRYRYINDRPANEDNSLVAEGYLVLDANAYYKWDHLRLGVTIENLFDTEWNQAQFATESRLQNELASVEEIHFTPGVPFFIKGVVEFKF